MAAYIGGVYYTEVTEGNGQTMLRVVPKEEQRRYVKETLKAIEDLSWLDTKLTEGQLANPPQSVQTDCPGNADETHGNPAPLPKRIVGSLHAGEKWRRTWPTTSSAT